MNRVTWREAVAAAGELVMISGQFGKIADGTFPVGDGTRPSRVAAQTLQALKNISDVLSQNGLSTSDVVKCTVSLASPNDYEAMNEEYARVFSTNQPARTTVAVQLLLADALVEIDCIASRKNKA